MRMLQTTTRTYVEMVLLGEVASENESMKATDTDELRNSLELAL